MKVFLDRIDSYTKASKSLLPKHVVLYKEDLESKRVVLKNFVKNYIGFPAEVVFIDGDIATFYDVEKPQSSLKEKRKIEITKFGEEPIRDEDGFCVFGEYPSLKTNKKEVHSYFEKHVSKESDELLLFTTSISIIKRFPWASVCVNPKINAGFGKLVLPTGRTVDIDFRNVQKWSNHMDFDLFGEPGKEQSENKEVNAIRFNAYSYMEAAKDREKMNKGDFSPKKLKKMDSKVRENKDSYRDPSSMIAYNMQDKDELIERRARLEMGAECNYCPVREKCPAFQEDALCAFNEDFEQFAKMFDTRDKDKIADGLLMILQNENRRYAHSAIMDKISNDDNIETRQLANSIFQNAKALFDILESNKKSSEGNKTLIINNNKNYNTGLVNEEISKLPKEKRDELLQFIGDIMDEEEIKEQNNSQ